MTEWVHHFHMKLVGFYLERRMTYPARSAWVELSIHRNRSTGMYARKWTFPPPEETGIRTQSRTLERKKRGPQTSEIQEINNVNLRV